MSYLEYHKYLKGVIDVSSLVSFFFFLWKGRLSKLIQINKES